MGKDTFSPQNNSKIPSIQSMDFNVIQVMFTHLAIINHHNWLVVTGTLEFWLTFHEKLGMECHHPNWL